MWGVSGGTENVHPLWVGFPSKPDESFGRAAMWVGFARRNAKTAMRFARACPPLHPEHYRGNCSNAYAAQGWQRDEQHAWMRAICGLLWGLR